MGWEGLGAVITPDGSPRARSGTDWAKSGVSEGCVAGRACLSAWPGALERLSGRGVTWPELSLKALPAAIC